MALSSKLPLIATLGIVGAGALLARQGDELAGQESLFKSIFGAHPEWTASRAHLADPLLPFVEAKPAHERTLHEQAMVDRAREIRRKDRESTHHY